MDAAHPCHRFASHSARVRRLAVGLAVGLAAGAIGAARASAGVAAQPAPLPPLTRASLPNGLDVVVARRPQRPVVALQLTIPAGYAHDPPALPGLAGFVADMLRQGTLRRSAQELAELVESTGGELSVSAQLEFTRIRGRWLARDLPRALELVAEMVTQPSFAEAELERMRPRWQAAVRQQFDDPAQLVARYADQLLYGPEHPLGRLPDERAALSVRRQDLVDFYQRYYTPDGALLVVVGDVEPSQVLELTRRHLGDWARRPQELPRIAPATLQRPRVRFVEWPGQTQVRVELRQPAPPITDDDWLAMRVYNYILGGGAFASRLMEVMRVRLGSTYDVHSYYSGYRFGSHWVLSTYTRNDQLWRALAVLQQELERFYRDGVTPEELEDALQFYVLSYPMRLETAADLAAALSDAVWQGRGLDWVSLFPVHVARLDGAQVNAALRRHFRPDLFAVTLLGDPSVWSQAPATVWGVPAHQVERVTRKAPGR